MAKKLMEQLQDAIATHQYSFETGKAYRYWVRGFILYHNKRHPRDMGATEIEDYLSHLATHRRVSASTQNQALAAILFLYHKVLDVDLPRLEEIVRAKRPERVPVVLSTAKTPPSSQRRAEGNPVRHTPCRDSETCNLPYVSAFLCYPSAGIRL